MSSGRTVSLAVAAERLSPLNSLDLFPTPPWATRALMHHVLDGAACGQLVAWEPANGLGHMSDVLREYFAQVHATDVHDYGHQDAAGSFIGAGADVIAAPAGPIDWVITNPPFKAAEAFLDRALTVARMGVALLVRTSWLEGKERFETVFRDRPPVTVAQFAERVPMIKGAWRPKASTATAYAWLVWSIPDRGRRAEMMWIPPGCRDALTRADDVARFAGREAQA